MYPDGLAVAERAVASAPTQRSTGLIGRAVGHDRRRPGTSPTWLMR
jgi:hypothetical protein